MLALQFLAKYWKPILAFLFIIMFVFTVLYYRAQVSDLENDNLITQQQLDAVKEINNKNVVEINECKTKITSLTDTITKINDECNVRIEKIRKDSSVQCKIGDTSKDNKLNMCLTELKKCQSNVVTPMNCDDQVKQYKDVIKELNDLLKGGKPK